MKEYLKFITIIVIAFVMMIGINVKADDDYYLYSDGAKIDIIVPIHKTDSNNKPLEGVEFTLKDFNNKVSYKSEDKEDGDYLIDVYKEGLPGKREDIDQDYRIIDETSEDEVLAEILDMLPTKYSDIFRNAENQEDFYDMLDLPLRIFNSSNNNYQIVFYIPLKIEETKVPTGYKAKNIVIPAFVYLGFDDGGIYARLSYTPGYWSSWGYEKIPAYFEYKDGIDYEKIFDNINNGLDDVNSDEDLLELFEDNGAIIDKECEFNSNPTPTPIPTPTPTPTPTGSPVNRDDLETRFDDLIIEQYCPIYLIDEKEDIKVNPETYGTFALVLVLAIAAGGFTIYRKNKKEA